jgi:hypothetical protein
VLEVTVEKKPEAEIGGDLDQVILAGQRAKAMARARLRAA